MNKNIKLWIKALRSGNYKQCRGSYTGQKPNSFCALGVAAEALGKIKINVGQAIGLSSEDTSKVISLNDKGHRSFSYIADWLEKRFLKTA